VRFTAKPALGLAGLLAAREAVGRLKEDSLAGEVALITGGSRGLGLELAGRLLAEGCRVAICARDEDDLARAREELGAGQDLLAIACDVADRAAVRRMVGEVTAHFGRIDILINNAGTITVGALKSLSLHDFQHAMRVMYWGTLYPTLAVLPQMRERRSGRIANITSIGGKISMPHLLPYNAAKAAAIAFSEGLRSELAADGIVVTTVVPGVMRTGSHLHARFAGDREAEYRWFALGAAAPTTMGAGRAARHIIRAVKRGQAEIVFPWTFSLLSRAHGLAPGVTADVLAAVDRALPSSDGETAGSEPGALIEARSGGKLWDAITFAGRRSAEDLNQEQRATEELAAAFAPELDPREGLDGR
jgi:NAD(P)-dependent dehydrogenase (short-subunit alcohol dehydrogenase family)